MILNTPNADLFISCLKNYGFLSQEAQLDLNAKIQTITKRKGSYIIKEGQTVSSFFVIRKGMIRSFFRRGNQEITAWFGYEGQQFAAITSFFDNKPSHETIECLENCEFQFISGKDMAELYQKHNDLNTIGRKIVEDYCKVLDDRIFALQTMSAEQRYKDLMQHHPEVIKRVSLGYIASFLGISQETLSRVRRK